MNHSSGFRLSPWQGIFYLLLAIGLVLTVIRFTRGLGAVTNLSDTYPWGLWVGFDILCGVGLAAGGFTITAMVYIFNAERFRPIVRPAVLTAFLGYLLVVTALLFDLGRPWNLWHPLVMWNPHSVLFEVAWCVMLYTTVLGLEFSGVVLEKLGWMKAVKIQKVFTVPLVIVGVLLSTLHQSSLGALYLVVPGKLHPLWYTSNLPLLFFASAISAGLAMVIVESRLSARAFGRQLELPLLKELGRYLMAVLGIYGVIRLCDLQFQGELDLILHGSYETMMFHLEYFIGVLLPFGLLAVPKVRESARGLYISSLFAVLGFVTNRLNVSITALEGAQGGHYVPAWSEIMITLMLVAIGFGAFSLAVRYLNVYPAVAESQPLPTPVPDPRPTPETASSTSLG
jgi:Ni/Fe-hydrogenase subunit HybB-like protein